MSYYVLSNRFFPIVLYTFSKCLLAAETSVRYLFSLLSSMYQFILLIIWYKGFTLFGVTYPMQ